jgi:hypothetical protein
MGYYEEGDSFAPYSYQYKAIGKLPTLAACLQIDQPDQLTNLSELSLSALSESDSRWLEVQGKEIS